MAVVHFFGEKIALLVMRFGRAAVRASCPLHGKVRLLFLENAKGLVEVALGFGGHGVGYAASG